MNRINNYFWAGWIFPNQLVRWQEFEVRVAHPNEVQNVPKGHVPIFLAFAGDFSASSLKKLLRDRHLSEKTISRWFKKKALLSVPLDDITY